MTRNSNRRRPGFTLIELLIVIVVIGILIALLLPAIFGALRTARDAATIAEETNIANALAAFKDKYGAYPPSRIMLNETLSFQQYGGVTGTYIGSSPGIWLNSNAAPLAAVADTSGNDITLPQLAQRSAAYMTKFFPRAVAPNFNTTNNSGTWNDFNGNAIADNSGTVGTGWIYLEGHECLVFFLGGIANNPSGASAQGTVSMTGFARSVTAPFTFPGDINTVNSPPPGSNLNQSMVSLNRNPPFFEFVSSRLGDNDLDSMLDYADYLTPSGSGSNLTTAIAAPIGSQSDRSPYVYFSAYEGAGYDPNDANAAETTPNYSNSPTILYQGFRVTLGLTSSVTSSPSPNPYTVSLSVPATVTPAAFQNPNTFQLVSAGADRMFGPGGQFNPTANDRLSDWHNTNIVSPSIATNPYADPVLRDLIESDNLTNFSATKLD